MLLNEEDISVWRRFKSGESACDISYKLDSVDSDVGIRTVLEIVLLVESQMGSSNLFYEPAFDFEGCPNPIKKTNVEIPRSNRQLETWLRG